jgi:hypothetical protein
MKNLENYVCTLEQAKRLKELGVEQDSLFIYMQSFHEAIYTLVNANNNFLPRPEDYSAFTSQELGEMISTLFPDLRVAQTLKKDREYESDEKEGYLFLKEHCSGMWLECAEIYTSYANTEAQARAEFLIYILEKKK